MFDNLFQPGSRFIHIKTISFICNHDEMYEVTITRYHPYRSRTYTTNENRVNALLKLADFSVEASGGNLEAHGMCRKAQRPVPESEKPRGHKRICLGCRLMPTCRANC